VLKESHNFIQTKKPRYFFLPWSASTKGIVLLPYLQELFEQAARISNGNSKAAQNMTQQIFAEPYMTSHHH